MLNLAFMRTDHSNPVQVAVSRFGPYWHAGMIFSSGVWFTSMPPAGVGFTRLGRADAYDLVQLPMVTPDQEMKVFQWCHDHAGEPYDWRRLVFGKPTPGHWFCSDACGFPLQLHAGLFGDVDLTLVHAGALYELATKL